MSTKKPKSYRKLQIAVSSILVIDIVFAAFLVAGYVDSTTVPFSRFLTFAFVFIIIGLIAWITHMKLVDKTGYNPFDSEI